MISYLHNFTENIFDILPTPKSFLCLANSLGFPTQLPPTRGRQPRPGSRRYTLHRCKMACNCLCLCHSVNNTSCKSSTQLLKLVETNRELKDKGKKQIGKIKKGNLCCICFLFSMVFCDFLHFGFRTFLPLFWIENGSMIEEQTNALSKRKK